MSIVIVDASDSDRFQITKSLEEGGFSRCLAVATVTEAYALLGIEGQTPSLTAFDVELIVLDMGTDFSGAYGCRRIKEVYQYQDIPVIMLADGVASETMQTAFAFGATDFIPKPIRAFELMVRVRSALRLKHEIDRRKARERELVEVTRQLADLNSMLSRLSFIDSLTNAPNRRYLDKSLDQEWRRALRNNHQISALMIDVDYFKLFNDHYGHQAGDDCLAKVASAIRRALRRPADLLARYGGEEFCVLLPETDAKGALAVGENIRRNVEDLAIRHGHSKADKVVTVSIGVSTVQPQASIQQSLLLEQADQALYRAKNGGRNRVALAKL